ncbi:MAG: glycosyltransferase [Bosea sp. (in: a-proteobacteria)]
MRLAFLTSLIPVARPDTGFEIANAAILNGLRAAGHDVTAIGFLRPGEVAADPERSVVLDHFAIENAAVSGMTKLRWLATAMARGLPVACAKLWLAGRGRLIETVRKTGPFDAIVLNSVMLPGAFPELLDIAPCVLVEHNVEYVSARQSADHADSTVMRWLYRREARTLEKVESETCAKAKYVWVLAEEDRQTLGALIANKSATVPLVSGSGSSEASALPQAAPQYDVGLIGTWTWAPNFIGLDWFLKEVAPNLRADIRVAVAGRLPEGVTAPANVELLGRVPDAQAFLASCRTLALTSRAGTGVQLKTIEAFQLGKPAVATPLSLRGFTELPGNVRRADEAAAFAEAVATLVDEVHAQGATSGGALREGQAFMARQREKMAAVLAEGLARAVVKGS